MALRYLVTGSSGFVGTHMVRRLARSGAAIVAIDLKPPREILPNVEYKLADVRDLSSLVIDGPFDAIYNFAAVHTTPGHETHEYYETNIAGALEITRLAERLGVNEIIFTSSISTYGPSEETKSEKTAPTPESAYGYSKYLAEGVHRNWLGRDPDKRKLTIVRPAVVFGPGEGGNFTRMARLLKKGFFIYPGRKDTIKACIYVDDLIEAIEFARARPENFILFNGCYPDRYTLQQIVEALIRTHFRNARTYMLPRSVVSVAAKFLGAFGFMNLGIHPDRVMKLVRSTDIYPDWLVENGFRFDRSIDDLMRRWEQDTKGSFV